MSTQPAADSVQPSGYFTQSLKDKDPAVFAGITQEVTREKKQIELIASENIVSKAVLEAQMREWKDSSISRLPAAPGVMERDAPPPSAKTM